MAESRKPIELVCRHCRAVNEIRGPAESVVFGGKCGECGADLDISSLTGTACSYCGYDVPATDPSECDCPNCGRSL